MGPAFAGATIDFNATGVMKPSGRCSFVLNVSDFAMIAFSSEEQWPFRRSQTRFLNMD